MKISFCKLMTCLALATALFCAFPKNAVSNPREAKTKGGQVLGYGEAGMIAPSESRRKVSNHRAKLNIVLLLQEYIPLATTALDGRVDKNWVAGEMTTYRLHAKMDQPQEFSMGNYQIRMVPIAWNRSFGELRLAIHLDRHHGNSQQLVESIGDWTLTGKVQAVDNDTYHWLTSATHTFSDQFGNSLLKLEFVDPKSVSSAAGLAKRPAAGVLK